MSNVNISPNMQLPVPVVGVDPGPQWGTDSNSCFSLIDQHNHSFGQGVQINPSGLNINADLTIGSNNLTFIRSSRYVAQASPLSLATDLGCTYVSGVDLYFNDENGNQIQITKNGGIAGTSGSIANLTSPASASYVSANSTFVFQSAANTSANIDGASILIRNLTANSNAVTLSAVSSVPSNYTITLPTLPVSTSFLGINSSGQISSVAAVSQGLTNANIATQTITQGLLALRTTGSTVSIGGVAISSSSSVFTTTAGVFTNITNLSVTITTTGRPVYVGLIPDQTNSSSSLSAAAGGVSAASISAVFGIFNGATIIARSLISDSYPSAATTNQISVPVGSLWSLDFPMAGTYTYVVKVFASSEAICNNAKLIAYEI